MTNLTKFLTEAAKIVTGNHPDWRGDRVYNFEYFCTTFAMNAPKTALAFAEEISGDIDNATSICGMSPRGCGIAASILRKTANKYDQSNPQQV